MKLENETNRTYFKVLEYRSTHLLTKRVVLSFVYKLIDDGLFGLRSISCIDYTNRDSSWNTSTSIALPTGKEDIERTIFESETDRIALDCFFENLSFSIIFKPNTGIFYLSINQGDEELIEDIEKELAKWF